MLAVDRRRSILNSLYREKRLVVTDLAGRFGVTEETIRRDLEKLEKEGFLNRTYGGAIINRHNSE
ncbi:DeoR family transcriptional regulator, partial [Staphylococcus aureus]|uniref:DeoR family transcriptional regulator n=1 Tax=Staphylococcus aureus TaxID=1280 RepID=UPI00338ECFDC